jgi:surface antigen
MLRKLLFVAMLALVPLALAAPHAANAKSHAKCEQDEGKKRRNSAIGGIFGGIASMAGVRPSIGGFGLPTGELLSEAISALLNCKEQQQAAAATNEAIRSGTVGSSSTWKSESRPNVSGSSTVTGQQQFADGRKCMTVTDVVIVDGEETTAPKKMCREPGASGWKRA